MKYYGLLAAFLAVNCALIPSTRGAPAPAPSTRARPGGIAPEPNQVRGDEITPRQKAAVERGLAWLASRQGQGGGYAGDDAGGPKHAGITALAGLAFMQAGNLPGRGRYGREVGRCLDYV